MQKRDKGFTIRSSQIHIAKPNKQQVGENPRPLEARCREAISIYYEFENSGCDVPSQKHSLKVVLQNGIFTFVLVRMVFTAFSSYLRSRLDTNLSSGTFFIRKAELGWGPRLIALTRQPSE